MRVLHAIRSDGFAGVERHVARLAAAQVARGHEVLVVGGHPVRMAAALADVQVDLRPGATVLDVARAVARLGSTVELLHVHMTAAEVAGVVGRIAVRRRPPVVATRHFARPRGASPSGRVVGRVTAGQIRAQIAISAYVAERVDGRSVVVYPGVDPRPDARPASGREPAVLVVQRLEPEKDTAVAVEAFARSGLAARGWRLDVAGDGALRPVLEQLARDRGVDNSVRFLGSRDDVPALMARSAVLVATCPIEGLGLTVLEAMAAGLPTVATASGGHLETLPPEGLEVTFPPGDADAAAAALRRLADDPALRDDLARIGQQRQRDRFTLGAQVAGTDAVYETVA